MNFTQKLRRIQKKHDSLLCIGLDSDLTKIPEHLFAWGDPLFEFNRRIIDATRDLVCAYKINLAFYEATGEHGWGNFVSRAVMQNQIPPDFPLHNAPAGSAAITSGIFLTDWERWKTPL